MPINYFLGKDENWLLAARDVIQDLMGSASGSANYVGIAQGIAHQFGNLAQPDLERRYLMVCDALTMIDPDKYPDQNSRPTQTIPVFR